MSEGRELFEKATGWKKDEDDQQEMEDRAGRMMDAVVDFAEAVEEPGRHMVAIQVSFVTLRQDKDGAGPLGSSVVLFKPGSAPPSARLMFATTLLREGAKTLEREMDDLVVEWGTNEREGSTE